MADEVEVEEYVPGERSQSWLHAAHQEYIETEYPDINLARKKPNEVIAIAFATRREFRASEIYEDAKAAHAEEVEEAKAALKEEREARKAERAAAAEEKKAAATEKSAKKPAARKGAAKKSGTTTRARRAKKTTEEDPFD